MAMPWISSSGKTGSSGAFIGPSYGQCDERQAEAEQPAHRAPSAELPDRKRRRQHRSRRDRFRKLDQAMDLVPISGSDDAAAYRRREVVSLDADERGEANELDGDAFGDLTAIPQWLSRDPQIGQGPSCLRRHFDHQALDHPRATTDCPDAVTGRDPVG